MFRVILYRRHLLLLPLQILHKKFSSFLRIRSNTCYVTSLPFNTPGCHHHKVNVQMMTLEMSTNCYFLISNQRLYNHNITHSMTLSMTHFLDAAWVTISVTVLSVTLRRCRFPWRFSLSLCRLCIPFRFSQSPAHYLLSSILDHAHHRSLTTQYMADWHT